MLAKYLLSIGAAGVALATPWHYPNKTTRVPSVTHTSTASSDIAAAAATALTESSTSRVRGKAFDRIMMIYLETTAYENAIADRKPPNIILVTFMFEC